MAMQMTRSDFMRDDYESMASELEVEVQTLTKEQSLRIEIDSELESALKELESLQSQLPKEQMNALFEQCQKNAIDAVVGHFGLAAVVLNSKDGGNVNTTHNVRKGIYASEAEKQRYENRGEYDSGHYHTDKDYIAIKKEQGEIKKQGKSIDYMTGKKIKLNDSADLDHMVSAKTIHDDRARVLAQIDGAKLANTQDNLTLTDSTLNRSKKTKTAEQFLARRDERITELKQAEQKRGYLTQSELNEQRKLKKQKEINDEEFKKAYNESKENIDKEVDRAYYESAKPYKEALMTGAQDAGKMAIYTAIGEILKEFIIGMSDELKTLFKEFGNESLGDIFKRFAKRLKQIWANLRARWKDIIAGSFEAGIVAFFGNLVVFVINIFFTTLKRIVRIIRAGFTSLYQAVKKLFDKNTPENERLFEASKIFVAGLISAVTMLSGEYITKWLYAIPGLNVLLGIPLPFLDETIGDALGLCISAALGAVLSTIAIYYMDKWANDKKIAGFQIQMMTKSGEIVQYKLMQTWFVLQDGYDAVLAGAERTMGSIDQLRNTINKYK
ncbi:hypothetical protein [Helicobacter sp. MIT 01-3238]|uniref:hypothetical protein n=1 Tax=Helicobacter sp. MIT 01-3238 TaxID=398627 RepID=UPI002162BB8C|nr:hypothetical protein [Helicobacter sp. MIT 01-3238]